MKTLPRYLLILLAVVVLSSTARAATRFSVATGNWNSTSTWSTTSGGGSGASVPVAGDTVTIERGFTVTVNISTAACASIQLGGPSSGAGTIAFNSGSQLTVSGAVTLGNSGSTTRFGTVTMTNGGTLICASLTSNSTTDVWTPGTGTVQLSATNTLPISNASGKLNTFNNLNLPTGTTTLGASIAVNGTLTQSGGNIAVGSFTLTVNGTHDAGTNTVSGAGGYTLASGATLLTANTSGVGGSITTTTKTLNTAANYTFDGTSAQVTSTTMPTTVNNLTINNAAGVTLSQGTTINGTLTVSSGTFTVGAFTISVAGTTTVSGTLSFTSATGTKTFTGNVTVNNGGNWNETVNVAISFGGNLQNDGTFTDGGGTHTFTGTTKTFSGANAISIANVTVSGTYTNNGTLTVGTALAGAGSLTQGTNATLNLGGTSGITTLTATATGNTVNFSGAAQTVNNTNYYHLTLSGSGAKTLGTSTTTISGNLTLSGTATATTVVGLAISGNLDVGSGTTLTVAGFNITVTGTTSVTGTLTHNNTTGTKTYTGNVTVNNGGNWNETVNVAISFAGNLQNDGTFTAGTGVHTFTGTAKTISGANAVVIPSLTISGTTTNNGTLTVSTTLAGASTLTNGTNATLNFGGSSITPTLTATASGNTVKYNLAGAQTVKGTTYNNLTLSGSGSKTTSSVTVNGTLSMQGTATASAAPTYGASATLEYKGSAAQTTGPEFLPTMATGRTVIINNASGVTLGASVTVNGTFTFTSGTVTTGSNTLYIGSGGTVSRTSGHVVGNFKKFIATGATSATFEVGDTSNYTPVTVAFASVTTAGDLTASTTAGDHPNISSSIIISAKTANRYWTLTNSGIVFTNYNVTFNFVSGDVDAGANTGNFVVGKFSSSTWTYPTVGTKTATSTQATGVTAFGDFQLGEGSTTATWTGAVNNLWSSGGNWSGKGGAAPVAGDDLIFPSGASNLSTSNDIAAGTSFNSITISGDGYTLAGNSIALAAGNLSDTNTSGSNTISLAISMSSTRTFSINNAAETLTIGGVISGAGGLTKTSAGTLTLTANNTYSGSTTVSAGTLLVNGSQSSSAVSLNGGALGGTGTVGAISSTASGGTLSTGSPASSPGQLNSGNVNLSTGAPSFVVQLNGTTAGSGYDQLNVTGTVNLTGATLSGTVGFTPAIGNTFTIINNDSTDAVTGTFAGLSEGSTVVLSGQSFTISYTGGTGNDVVLTRAATTFTWDGSGADNNWTTTANWVGNVAPVAGDSLVFDATGVGVRPSPNNDFAAATSFGTITVSAGGYTIGGNSVSLSTGLVASNSSGSSTVSLVMGGAGTVTKSGAGTLTLSAANTYTGATTINGGVVNIQNATALGTTALGTTVASGARLEVQGGIAVGAEALTINSTGGGSGALLNVSGSNSWAGAITLGSASTIGSTAGTLTGSGGITNGGFLLTVAGAGNTTLTTTAISGTGGLTKTDGGTLTLSAANSYTGATTINGGVVSIVADNNLGTAPGSATAGQLTFGGGTLATTATFTLNSNRGISFSSTGTIDVASSTTLTYGGIAAGSGGLTKTSAGTLTLNGANTYTGTTMVSAGTLLVNGSQSSSAVSVNGGTLGGTGTVGTITSTSSGGTISVGSPAGNPGILNSANVDWSSGGPTFVVELNGPTAGTSYDQLNVTGTLNLTGATLSGTVGFTPASGATFTIINNDGSDAVTGTFAGLSEGSTVVLSGQSFTISYVGGTGNDVVLTRAAPNVTLDNSVNPSGTQPPGTDLVYTVTFTNTQCCAAQSLVLIDPIPANTDFKVGSVTSDPGTTGLTVAVTYSNDSGSTYTYTPVSGGGGAPAGYDRNVTNIKWTFTGNLSQSSPNNTGSIGFTSRIR